MAGTYKHHTGRTVEIGKGGVVLASDSPSYPVGSTVARGQMTACGWKKDKPVAQVYANGLASGRRFKV